MNILVVDDSKAMRMIMIRTLRHAGYGDHDVVQAGNGAEALSMIEASPPDLILCDWKGSTQVNEIFFYQVPSASDTCIPLTGHAPFGI